MDISIKKNNKNVEEFNYLFNAVNWGAHDDKIAETALNNSVFSVSIYDKEKIIAYGRLVGDVTCYIYIHDVIVIPEYQSKKIGTLVMNELLKEIDKLKEESPNLRVYLGASKNREAFYEKFGFVKRTDAGLGSGMVLKTKK